LITENTDDSGILAMPALLADKVAIVTGLVLPVDGGSNLGGRLPNHWQ